VIKAVIKLSRLGDILPHSNPDLPIPSTVDEAVKHLASGLSVKGRGRITRLEEDAVQYLLPSMGVYVTVKFHLWGSNEELPRSCSERAGQGDLNEDQACFIILKTLWQHLRDIHKSRGAKVVPFRSVRKKSPFLLLLVLFLTFPPLLLAGQFKISRVSDGDTVKALGHDIEIKVRMVGIDAPGIFKGKREPGQPFSDKSQKYLASLILNKTVEIKGYGSIS
jgi:hypothetical protein